MPGQNANLVHLQARNGESLGTGDTGCVSSEKSETFRRNDRLAEQGAQQLEGFDHLCLGGMIAALRREEREYRPRPIQRMSLKPVEVLDGEVVRAGEFGEVA